MYVTFNGKVYAGPAKRTKRANITRNRTQAVRWWGGAAVKMAETNHVAMKHSILGREYV